MPSDRESRSRSRKKRTRRDRKRRTPTDEDRRRSPSTDRSRSKLRDRRHHSRSRSRHARSPRRYRDRTRERSRSRDSMGTPCHPYRQADKICSRSPNRQRIHHELPDIQHALGTILSRLNALESNNASSVSPSIQNNAISDVPTCAKTIADAISIALPASRIHIFYVSNFDPNIHNIEVWCQVVDRAKQINNWDDYKCVSLVSGCLKGDAKVWLNEWVTNDRSWSNFKREFVPLCPHKLDFANILYETMNTTSD